MYKLLTDQFFATCELSQTPACTVKPQVLGYPHLLYATCLITIQLSPSTHCTYQRVDGQAELRWMAA